ncbi:glutathione S-transferase family protein [Ostreibacterium oceani]|uniref:Glutathione S-transferase n=1 Tax=Ostreibacterium oceani TaxID=2654998 RepID=A0A6N7EYC0_9GAMM|nr:glutathione S-transferase family protein [Ostreibacterium oceani]MPV85478.1 hypothetical protein [Ostreibacterium oceani]
MQPIQVIGYPISPYVKKVLAALNLIGVDYELDPLNPFTEKARLTPINAAGQVPVLVYDGKVITESPEICLFLHQHYPDYGLYPSKSDDIYRINKLEAFADSAMMIVFGARLLHQRVIIPTYTHEPPNHDIVHPALQTHGPQICDTLEAIAPPQGFLSPDGLSIADIMIGATLHAGLLAGFCLDENRWPLLSRYIQRILSHRAVAPIIAMEAQYPEIKQARIEFAYPFPSL